MPSEKAYELVDEIRFMLSEDEFHYTMKEAAERIDKAIAEAVKEATAPYIEALTPSAETKGEYSGEFWFWLGMEGPNEPRTTVPWDTVKEIMAAIRARAESAKKDGV